MLQSLLLAVPGEGVCVCTCVCVFIEGYYCETIFHGLAAFFSPLDFRHISLE